MDRALTHPPGASMAILPRLPWLAALVSLAAAGIHFAMAPAHFDEYWLFGWFFIATAWLQAMWAIALVGFGSRAALLIAGICLNLLVVAIWVSTRTVGVPIGPEAGATEAWGWVDATTTGFEIGVVILAAGLLRGTPVVSHDRWSGLWLVIGGLVLAGLVGAVLATSGESAHSDGESSGGTHAEGEHE